MKELIVVGFLLAIIIGAVLALAPRVSAALVNSKARRLPDKLSARMQEEWLAELGVLPGRASQLAFAIALTLTRRHSFAVDDESLFAVRSRTPITLATFGGWPTVVLFTTVVMAAIAYAGSFLIQPLYRAHTVILVVPQRVPPRFVAEATHVSFEDRMRTLRASVLSRPRLERTILEFNLYSADRLETNEGKPTPNGPRALDAVIDRMRRDATIDVRDDGETLEVAYVSTNARTAMLVTERLASLLINENMQDRSAIHDFGIQFLDAEIEDVRSRLLKAADTRHQAHTSPSHVDVRPVEHDRLSTPDRDDDVRALEHESLKAAYRDLLGKREQLLRSANLERQQIGEQFKIVDGARLPEVPISPDRRRLTLLGALVGFCLGIAMMVAGREGSFRRREKMVAQS